MRSEHLLGHRNKYSYPLLCQLGSIVLRESFERASKGVGIYYVRVVPVKDVLYIQVYVRHVCHFQQLRRTLLRLGGVFASARAFPR